MMRFARQVHKRFTHMYMFGLWGIQAHTDTKFKLTFQFLQRFVQRRRMRHHTVMMMMMMVRMMRMLRMTLLMVLMSATAAATQSGHIVRGRIVMQMMRCVTTQMAQPSKVATVSAAIPATVIATIVTAATAATAHRHQPGERRRNADRCGHRIV